MLHRKPVYVDVLAVFAILSGLMLTSELQAQTAAGQVNGTITDPTGGSVSGARVTLRSLATNIGSDTTSNASGFYTFVNVQPGTYVISIESTGFKTLRLSEFEVGVNQTVTHDVTLALGQVNESVDVRAEAEMVQQSSAELGTVIPEAVVHDLPLNGRNFTQLLTLTPGATPISTSQGAQLGVNDGSTVGIPGSSFANPSLEGQFNRSVLYYLDGIINTDLRTTTYTVLPNIDLIQEFKVQSHNDKAEYGGVTGGVVNVISTSGSNHFHGSAYEFVRNNYFDARDPFADATSSGPAPFRQNQFGATLSGPIFRNKTFFSGGYEGWRYSKPTQAFARVPTAAELSGDFSNSIINHAIYNPYTTVADAQGNLHRQPFPNNIVPASMISPMMQGFLQAYSEVPNYTGDPFYNFIVTEPLTNNSNSWQVKLDHRLRDADSLFFRWSQMRVDAVTPQGLKSASAVPMVANDYGGGWTHLFSPNILLDVRGGSAARDFTLEQTSTVGLEPMKKLGFADVDRFGGLAMSLLQPWNNAGGLGGSVGVTGPAPRGNPVWNISANLSWLKGNHNLKMGFQYLHVARLQINQSQTYNFDNNVTADPQNLGQTGASLASALLGLPVTFTGILPGTGDVRFSMAQWSAFFQDEWKLTPNITVNLGLRFDHTNRISFDNNGFTAGPDLQTGDWLIGLKTLPPPCNQANQAPCIPGNGLQDVPFSDHIKLYHPGFVPTPEWDNWGPRASIAWRFTPKMVLRAGYGLFFDGLPALTQMAQNNSEVKWPDSSGFSGTANQLGEPLTPIQSIQGNFPTVLPEASPWDQSGWFNNPRRKDAYSHQWNVEIQRQMTANLLLSAGYVGSVNRRLEYSGLGNMARTPGPGSPAEVDARRPMPYMWGGFFYSDSIGRASYNALQLKAQRRFADGLQMLISYTWSKSLDTGTSGWFGAENGSGDGSSASVQDFYHPNSNRSVSSYNIPQFLSWSTVYELPFGHGKRWLTSGPAAWFLGDWQINSIVQARSGQPFTLAVTGDVANIGNDVSWWNYARPNLVGDPTPSHRTAAEWYNPAAFAVPQFSFGNFGRNVLSSDHVFGADISLFKIIPMPSENLGRIELRFESFNTFNVINYGIPGSTVDQANAGRVSTVAAPPRQMQFGIKYLF